MKLYEINDKIYELLNQEIMDPETGEILDINGFDQLKELEIERDTKIENTGLFIKNLEVDVSALKEEERRLAERRKVKENKLNWTKRFLDEFLKSEDVAKFETPKVKMSFRKSESVNIFETAILPDEYIHEKTEYIPDKTAIKKAIKSGAVVDGAELVESQNLQVK
jgi:Siphovirus Gp157.